MLLKKKKISNFITDYICFYYSDRENFDEENSNEENEI